LLGKEVLNLAITYHWYRKPLSADQLRTKQRESLSDNRLSEVMKEYNLAAKLRYAPGTSVGPEMCRSFLDTYVGALFIRNGLNAVQNYVSKLVDTTQQEDAEMTDTVLFNPYSQSPPPPPPPPSHPPPPVPPTDYNFSVKLAEKPPANAISLAIFNQVVTQRGYMISWHAESTGPPHQPTWTVRCCLNGIEKGRGTGKSQKLAKEDAARQAWSIMGGFMM
jgi:dsRNA-specific ribonuclease